MRFRIRVIIMLLLTVIALAAGIPCAAESDPADRLRDAADNIEIPEAAQPYLTESGLSASDPESLLTISPSEMLQTVLHTAADEAAAPLRLCGTLLALTVLTTVLSSLNDAAAHPSMKSLFDAVGTLLCVTAAASPLCTCLIRTADAFQTGRVFMGSSVPVFAAFIAAGGSVAGGAAYQIFVLFLTETVMQIAGGILFPLLQMAAALGIVDAVNPKLHLGCFVSGIHKGVTWLLGFLMALFSALLSVGAEKKYDKADAALCVLAQNDLVEPGEMSDYERILEGLKEGVISRAHLERNARNLLQLLLRTHVYCGKSYYEAVQGECITFQ